MNTIPVYDTEHLITQTVFGIFLKAMERIAVVAEKLRSKELFSQKAAEAKKSLASVSLPL